MAYRGNHPELDSMDLVVTPAAQPTSPPPCLPQIGNRLRERGFEDSQLMYKVSCYSAKVREAVQ